jgi:hypothetical protein
MKVDEDSMSEDEEDEDNFMPEPVLSLFAQLWSTLSDWPTPRSREFLNQSTAAQVRILRFKAPRRPSNAPPPGYGYRRRLPCFPWWQPRKSRYLTAASCLSATRYVCQSVWRGSCWGSHKEVCVSN